MNKKEHSKNSILQNVIQRVVEIVPSLDDNIAVAVIICLARALSFGLNLCHVSLGLICDGWTPPHTHTHPLFHPEGSADIVCPSKMRANLRSGTDRCGVIAYIKEGVCWGVD
ncbi:hypothetical protein CDAR_532551 [Caerostris darwini]|uniref:Uncharacterized protein n=1 Tax=Caerostris darwini TaxID=1538125 RepID=A0AAV4U527_9ARAC|nr:hypothetical protein CDAR_532551 [Caerostris darwini]